MSLWFPRLAAEHSVRQGLGMPGMPFAVVGQEGQRQVLVSLSIEAEAAGLRRGQPLSDAYAMCSTLQTRLMDPQVDHDVLNALCRWAGKFSPWVSEEPPETLVADITGCAHLFGGEATLLDQVKTECAGLGLTLRASIADSVGAAWALARFSGKEVAGTRSGDDIAQEARATRSRAARRRHWERGGPKPEAMAPSSCGARIVPPGQVWAALADLPVAALRIEEDMVARLNRLGLRRIGDLAGQPRAGLRRRFGHSLLQRLDQALGTEPEPVNPARPRHHFGVRLTLPEPIGSKEDIEAAIKRLLPTLEERLRTTGRGMRQVRLECHRSDHKVSRVEIGLAHAVTALDRVCALLMMKADGIDAGCGIDMIRLVATVAEPVTSRAHATLAAAAHDGTMQSTRERQTECLLNRIGARIGLETVIRLHPAESHIPEKTFNVLHAAWSEPAKAWPQPRTFRPLELWRPEIVTVPKEGPELPATFHWRGRAFETRAALGPERIAPEWWLDEPEWRTGVRDYWRVTTRTGERLWLYFAHGAAKSPGWFCQGSFC